ncbi:MAG: hypothetical protein JW797_19915 [Bradymonadales bacterium]|nr:hypothetical protein [Bradymonadales bacterium]
MDVRPLDPADPALAAIEEMLGEHYRSNLASYGALSREGTVLFACFEDSQPIAFGIFRNYRDPELHVGSHIDLDQLADILQMEEVGLYQVALLHARHPDRLVETTEALLAAFEGWLVEHYQRHGIFITLFEKGNRLARPLYKRLGFKKVGRPSSLMRFDLHRSDRFFRKIPPLPEALVVRFFEEVGEAEKESFAECYRTVFLRSARPDPSSVFSALTRVVSAPDFDPYLSCLLWSHQQERVVGFMLAQRPEPLQPHILVVGLLPEFRGQRLPLRCFPFIARRALAQGLSRGTFVTTQSMVVRLAMRAFGARQIERIQPYLKVG